jgi:hypothetical protein
MSYNDMPFTDGFNGKTLSIFDESKFKNEKIVHLVKVHGSLNWFDINGETHFLPIWSTICFLIFLFAWCNYFRYCIF